MGILDPVRKWFVRKQEADIRRREIALANRQWMERIAAEGYQVISSKVVEYASNLKQLSEGEGAFTNSILFTSSSSLKDVEDTRMLIGNDPFARRAIDFVSNLGSNIPLRVYDSDEELVEVGTMADFAKQPCSHLSYADWIKQSMGWMISAGRLLYMKERVGTGLKLTLIPANNFLLPIVNSSADYVSRIKKPFAYYRYGTRILKLEECIYTYVWSPSLPALFEAYGEGLLTAARLDLGVNVHGAEMIYQLYRKGGLPPYFYELETDIDEDEFARQQAQIKNRMVGPEGVSNVPGLPPGVHLSSLPISAKELQINQLRQTSSEAIAVAVGVSLALLKSGTMTYENLLQGKILCYESTVCPLLNKIAGALNADPDLIDAEGKKRGYHYAFDYTSVKDLVPLSPQAFTAAIPNLYVIMDESEIRQYSPWPLSKERPGNKPRPKPPKPTPEGNALGVLVDRIKERDAKPVVTLEDKIKESKTYGGYPAEVCMKFWEARDKELKHNASVFAVKLKAIYEEEQKKVLNLLQTVKRDLSDLPKVNEWLDWDKEQEKLRDMAAPILLEVFTESAHKISPNFIPNKTQRAKIKKFAKDFGINICDTTYSKFNDAIENVKARFASLTKQEEDEEPEDKKDELKKAVGAIFAWCLAARLIADSETETHQAQGYGITEGADDAGKTGKIWLLGNPPSGKHREWHESMDGQLVGIDENFVSGQGNELAYPGDTTCGDPSEFVKCYCQMMPV